MAVLYMTVSRLISWESIKPYATFIFVLLPSVGNTLTDNYTLYGSLEFCFLF